MRTLVIAALLLVLTGRVRADDTDLPPGTQAVAPELLRGRTLLLETANCSVEAPVGFEWLASPGMTEKHPEVRMFLCRDSQQSRIFMLQVYDRGFAQLDQKGMDDFLQGAKGSMEQQGWKFDGMESKPSRVPVEGSSFRFVVKLKRKDGQPINWIGYVSTAEKMYCLSSMQIEEGERPEFNGFAKSFKLLRPVSQMGSFMRAVGSFGMLAVLGGIAGSITFVIIGLKKKKAEGEPMAPVPAEAAESDVDEDDETDAFKPKPIVPKKVQKDAARVPEKRPREKTRLDMDEKRPRDKTRLDADEKSRPKTRQDEETRRPRSERPRPDEKSDRPRKNDRPFG